VFGGGACAGVCSGVSGAVLVVDGVVVVDDDRVGDVDGLLVAGLVPSPPRESSTTP